MSAFIAGRRFVWKDLQGSEHDDTRTLTVIGCTVTGNLNIKLDGFDDLGPSLYSVDLLTAKEMVKDGIWTEE